MFAARVCCWAEWRCTDLLHRGGELQAQLNDLVLGDCEVADPCQRGPAGGQRREKGEH